MNTTLTLIPLLGLLALVLLSIVFTNLRSARLAKWWKLRASIPLAWAV